MSSSRESKVFYGLVTGEVMPRGAKLCLDDEEDGGVATLYGNVPEALIASKEAGDPGCIAAVVSVTIDRPGDDPDYSLEGDHQFFALANSGPQEVGTIGGLVKLYRDHAACKRAMDLWADKRLIPADPGVKYDVALCMAVVSVKVERLLVGEQQSNYVPPGMHNAEWWGRNNSLGFPNDVWSGEAAKPVSGATDND